MSQKSLQNGEHLIHLMDCLWLPDLSQLHVLGEFQTFGEARQDALRRFAKVNACFLCLPEHFQRSAGGDVNRESN